MADLRDRREAGRPTDASSDRESVILDVDPGQDDAVNLLLAMAARERLRILGVTAVAGNVPLVRTARNARLICELAGREDLAVYPGCPRPMVEPLMTAESVHGTTGIDGMEAGEPRRSPSDIHAVDFIVETLRTAPPASVTLVPTGPLTNIAMAIVKDPSILTAVKRVVLMGGAMREGGNFSASAEFNMLVDPHAARVVFECGRPVVAIGLDATHQVIATPERVRRIGALDNPAARATAGMLGFFARHDSAKYGFDGAPLHDPCTVAWLLQPELFSGRECHIEVETASQLTRGHTAVDYWGVSGRTPNALWVDRVDADGFFDLLTDHLGRY